MAVYCQGFSGFLLLICFNNSDNKIGRSVASKKKKREKVSEKESEKYLLK